MIEPPEDPARVITIGEPTAYGVVQQTWYVTAGQWDTIRAILGREPDEERAYSTDEMLRAAAVADGTELPPVVRFRPA